MNYMNNIFGLSPDDFYNGAKFLCLSPVEGRVEVGDIVRVSLNPIIENSKTMKLMLGDKVVYNDISRGLMAMVSSYNKTGSWDLIPLERVTEEQLFTIRMSGDISILLEGTRHEG